MTVSSSFEFEYRGSELIFGRGCTEKLETILADRNIKDALIVCGSNVGANEVVMAPLRRNLGDRLVEVFDETTPEKDVETVYDGIEAMEAVNPDALIAVGGGSSLDIARQMSVFAAAGRSLSDIRRAAREGTLKPPEPDIAPTPIVVVPTTFAGADLSSGGSVTVLEAEESPTGQPIRTGGSVRPIAMIYDPDLFETTPMRALAGSAMNGFDKGLETIYSRHATPITDATAMRGLQLLRKSLPGLDGDNPTAMEQAVIGIILVQFERRGSIIHAIGHGFARRYPVQQGIVHAIVAPHVLRYLFRNVDGRRRQLAQAFDVDEDVPDNEVSAAIVDEVVAVRDGLAVPTRLRDVDGIDERELETVAEFALEDALMSQAPAGLKPTVEDVESILREAW
ncbi:iron-containing alcohol dehydrogenase family protein [Natrinema soli]|uniref:Iron-containing alcohol dehydrogenase family protein n=1 Tax=Natrinema soli TaxID=1930624 RepID=A0ABD5SN15_9EURY|nr:iron-containing alcohol dehydrogenase family protein [Natrinema soli]